MFLVFLSTEAATKFLKIYKKTPVLESLFNNVADLQVSRPGTLLKRAPTQVFFCKCCKTIKNTHFEKHLRMNASISN